MVEKIKLKKGREKLAKNFHPWVYSGAIENFERLSKDVQPGQIVKVCDSRESFIAYGFFNPFSKIAIRLCEWDERKMINRDWIENRIRTSINLRKSLNLEKKTDSYRLIFGEADSLPGLVVDRYSDFLSLQISAKGMERLVDDILSVLIEIIRPKGIFLKLDEFALVENISLKEGRIYGEIPEEVEIFENGIRYFVDLNSGQKTGFFIDQRNNRERLRNYVYNKKVLDVFCYTGGFCLNAIYGGAKNVVAIDSSQSAIDLLSKNFELNDFEKEKANLLIGDAFEILRDFVIKRESFDIIVLDPPKFAKREKDVERALRAYKDINMIAMKLLVDYGILFSFSCSGNITRDDLKKALSWAAIDAGKRVKVIENLFQSEDHPILLSYPESEYLKGFVCIVSN